jgi:hypothetical protein
MISVIFSAYDDESEVHCHNAPSLVNNQCGLEFYFREFCMELATKLANQRGVCITG